MGKFALILIFLSLTCCNFQATGNNASYPKAVYFVHGQGELSSQDLQAHPEIVVVQTFDDFRKYASRKMALWIDKSATPFDSEQEEWINEAPQIYDPIVLVGTSDTLHAFKGLLRICCFSGPASAYPGYDAPGFSVIQWEMTNEPNNNAVIFAQGYNQKPTVQSILEITNSLLEGKLKPTATVPYVPVASPTFPTF
ncbi:MAG: hypothetical protein ABSA23_07485 [Anaerolineales bacterium]|jgi:hypothetical protein